MVTPVDIKNLILNMVINKLKRNDIPLISIQCSKPIAKLPPIGVFLVERGSIFYDILSSSLNHEYTYKNIRLWIRYDILV